jgi:Zn-dependent peptidase ImmA (M78 family)
MLFDDTTIKRAIRDAEQFITNEKIERLPIDLMQIARDLGIKVFAKPASAKGVSGMLIRDGENYAIAYATHIQSEGFQRFSIAHELGHYLLTGHPEHLLPDGKTSHESHGGFVSSDPYELQADYFAAGLLMPNPLFSKAMKQLGEGIAAVDALATLCRTSLTATAIRYVQCTNTASAMVMSSGNKIDYCFMSDEFKELPGLTWIRKGELLAATTATYQFNRNPERIARGDRTEATASTQDWFGSRRNMQMTEEIVGLGSYEKTLTILSLDDDGDEDEDEDSQRED